MGQELAFLTRHPADVARDLIGSRLVVDGKHHLLTELEAYGNVGEDPASHAFRGSTARNQVMFERCGLLYVYFIYGMHWCANIVSHEPGRAGAILIRATDQVTGPARLCSQSSITGADNGLDLLDPGSRVRLEIAVRPLPSIASPRVGISKGQEIAWRFVLDPHSAARGRDTAG